MLHLNFVPLRDLDRGQEPDLSEQVLVEGPLRRLWVDHGHAVSEMGQMSRGHKA